MKKVSGKILAVVLTAALFLGFMTGCSKKEQDKEEADFIANKTWYIEDVELTFLDDGTVEYVIASEDKKGTMQYEWDNKTMTGKLTVQDWTLDMKRDGDRIELLDGSGSQGFLVREKPVSEQTVPAKDRIVYYGKTECRFAADGTFTAAEKTGTYTWDENKKTGELIVDGKTISLKEEGSRITLSIDGEDKGIFTERARETGNLGTLEGQTWYYEETECHFKKNGVFEVKGKKGTYTWNDQLGTGSITLNGNTVVMFVMDEALELEDQDGSQGMLTKLPMIVSGK